MADLPDGFFNLKHRLVGATVLILVAVVLLPRVLTGTDVVSVRSSVNARTAPQIQPQVLAEVNPSDSDLAKVSKKTRIEILDQPAVAEAHDRTEAVRSNELPLARVAKDRMADTPLPSNSLGSKSIVTGFKVQLGIFQRPENIRILISNLKKNGVDAKVETVELDGRQATQIWLGPFSTWSEATREGNKAMMLTQSKPIIKEWP